MCLWSLVLEPNLAEHRQLASSRSFYPFFNRSFYARFLPGAASAHAPKVPNHVCNLPACGFVEAFTGFASDVNVEAIERSESDVCCHARSSCCCFWLCFKISYRRTRTRSSSWSISCGTRIWNCWSTASNQSSRCIFWYRELWPSLSWSYQA